MILPTSFIIMNIRLLITFALVVATFAACSSDSSEGGNADAGAGTPVAGEWVVIHELSDIEGLNPIITNDAAARAICDRVFEKLLEQDFETTDLIPSLAEARPVVSDDHLKYTFTLREGATFSDGKPLTSADVVFSMKVIKNPLIIDAAPLRNYYNAVKSVSAPDSRTIVFEMSEPYFLAEYFLGGMYVLPKHIFDAKNLSDGFSIAETNDMTKATSSPNPAMKELAEWFNKAETKLSVSLNVGSGPYIFEEWSTGQRIVIKRNDKWWNAGKDKWNPAWPEKIIYKIVNDRSSAVVAVKNQEIDFMEYVPPAKFTEEIDTNVLTYLAKYPYESHSYNYIGWNGARSVLSDKRTRKALSHLVDRPALINQIVRGLAVPVNSPVYQQRPEYDNSIVSIDFNPGKAKALLAEAGWSDSNGDGILDRQRNGKREDLSFTFLLNAGNEMREQIALILTQEFRKVGIDARIKKLEWAIFLQNLRGRQFDAYIGGWVNDPIPTDPYQIWHSSQADNQGSNYVAFRNERADWLMENNRTEFDEAKRIAYMREFQQIVFDEQPYTFLWAPLYPSVRNKRLQNVRYSFVRPGYNPTQWWVPRSQWKNAPTQ